MSTPVSDDRLVELLLDRGTADAARELAALRADAATAARIAALEELFGAAANAVRAVEPSPQRTGDLARRILARTTREDLSWRGDLRLVANHVKDRLRESRFTRTVAALLLGNLTIGPVVAVAWVLTHDPEPELELHFQIEPRGALLPEPEGEALQPLPDDAPPLDGVETAMSVARRDNVLRRARYQLAPAHGVVAGIVEPAPDAAAPIAVRLLDARARLLAGGAWPAWLDGTSASGADDLLAAALRAELLLDRFALAGERAPGFHAALENLRNAVKGAADGPARRLGAHALERAASYGAMDRAASDRAADSGSLDPLDAAWRADLGEALGDAAGEAHATAWIVSGR